MRRVGDLDPLDLRILFESRGLEFLPYPIAMYGTRTLGSAEKYEAHAADVVSRFSSGDLAVFRPCLAIILSEPDIRVEYYSHNLETDKPLHRVAFFRKGQQACLLRQLGDDDRVEVGTLSAFDIGAAITVMAPTPKPGSYPAVTVEGYTASEDAAAAAAGSSEPTVRQRVSSSSGLPHIATEDIEGFGSVQSDWRPARDWGRDPDKELIRWVYTKQGTYMLARDDKTAAPMTTAALLTRIDKSIAADAASLRNARGIQVH
ncbi:Uncharacterised protein [Mycolicibacterium fortuitum]|uniref:ESX secretion-associated protein EspG n=1 Tax=Mycolicibacterium fortuitum TaxID=1766 RepID=A0A378WCK9_MYCFO|nr:Uncharacterised protein [Mycolicibacterium fortuitum]